MRHRTRHRDAERGRRGRGWVWTTFAAAGAALALLIAFREPALAVVAGDPHLLADAVARWGPLAPLAAVSANVVQAVVAPIPGTAVVFLNGALFGLWTGALLNWVGGIAGALACFGIARTVARPWAARLIARSPRLESAAARLGDADGGSAGWGVAVSRFVPGAPFDLISYASGAVGIRAWPFVWGTALGSAPHALAYAALGTSLAVPLWAGLLATSTAAGVFSLVARAVGRRRLVQSPAIP